MTPQEVIDRLTKPAVEVDKDFVIAAVQCARALKETLDVLNLIAGDVEFYDANGERNNQSVARYCLARIQSIFNPGAEAGRERE